MSENPLYFLAFIPPVDISDYLWQLKRQVAEEYQSKAALRSPPHVTFHMPFRLSDKKKEKLVNIIASFCQDKQPIPIRLKDFGSFPPKVIYVQVQTTKELSVFHKDLCNLMAKKMSIYNANYRNRAFRPHITIAFRDLKKAQFHRAWDFYRSQHYEVNCTMDQLSLLKHNGREWQPDYCFNLKIRNGL